MAFCNGIFGNCQNCDNGCSTCGNFDPSSLLFFFLILLLLSGSNGCFNDCNSLLFFFLLLALLFTDTTAVQMAAIQTETAIILTIAVPVNLLHACVIFMDKIHPRWILFFRRDV